MTKKQEKKIKELGQQLKRDKGIQHAKDEFINLICEVYEDSKLYEQMAECFVDPQDGDDMTNPEVRDGWLEYASRILVGEVFKRNGLGSRTSQESSLEYAAYHALHVMFPKEAPVAKIETMHEKYDYNE